MSPNFNSSRLVRLLGDSMVVGLEPSRQDFAQRLGQWLGAVDAVTLHTTLQAIKGDARQAPAASPPARSLSVDRDVHLVRTALVEAITAGVPQDAVADYAPYHKRYADLQRQMESKITPLRSRVRQRVSAASPQLRQLAMLDAVMAQMLAAREQKLLSTVPVFLEKRFEHWRQVDQSSRFSQEWQAALLAELELRLQPVMGLMDAFNNEVKKHQ